jgi:hypothetical protein
MDAEVERGLTSDPDFLCNVIPKVGEDEVLTHEVFSSSGAGG